MHTEANLVGRAEMRQGFSRTNYSSGVEKPLQSLAYGPPRVVRPLVLTSLKIRLVPCKLELILVVSLVHYWSLHACSPLFVASKSNIVLEYELDADAACH